MIGPNIAGTVRAALLDGFAVRAGVEQPPARRGVDDASGRRAVLDQRDVDGEVPAPLDELLRSIERIDQNERVRRQIVARQLFLGDDGDVRERRPEPFADDLVGGEIGLGDRRRVGLGHHLEIGPGIDLHDPRARLEREGPEGRGDHGMVHPAGPFPNRFGKGLWTIRWRDVNMRAPS